MDAVATNQSGHPRARPDGRLRQDRSCSIICRSTCAAAKSSAWSARPAAASRCCCAPSSASFRSEAATSRSWAWNSTRQRYRKFATIGRRWGILFQQGALFSSLTVRQNVQFPMRENLTISQSLLDELATAKLEMVGLTPDDGRQISLGTVRRHDQARGAGAGAGARSRDRLSRRADLRSRSDLRRRIRCVDQDLAADLRADRVHGHPRS